MTKNESVRTYPKDMPKEMIIQLEKDLLLYGVSNYKKVNGKYVRLSPEGISITKEKEEPKDKEPRRRKKDEQDIEM